MILLIEDEPALQEVTCEYLRALGHIVLVASSGEQAVEIVAKQNEKISVLITDISLPGISGQEVVERLRVREPLLKVIYISGFSEESAKLDRAAEATSIYLQKPFSLRSLGEKIRKLFDEA
jgi:two-component system cell cycle sensor histidine kinase/response regulator CckA